MNLLLINYEYPPIGGGASNACQELAREMIKMGHRVVVVTSRTPDQKGLVVEGSIYVYRLRCLRSRCDRSSIHEMLIFLCSALFSVVRIARKNNIEAVICFFSLPVGPIGLLLKWWLKLPYVVSLRGGDVPGLVPELDIMHRLFKTIRRKVLSNSEVIVANSIDLAERSRLVDPNSIVVIPNGVDTNFYKPVMRKAITKDSTDLRLLFVGRFQRQKNLPSLLAKLAFANQQHGFSFHLTLVGDGQDRDELKHLIEVYQLSSLVDWKGWLQKDELRKVYQQSDCLLNLSLYEGLPNTILEAMACGLVVIASDIAPHRELISNGITGYLVSNDDTETFVNILKNTLNNPEECYRISQRCRELVVNDYRWRTVASNYLAHLQIKPNG